MMLKILKPTIKKDKKITISSKTPRMKKKINTETELTTDQLQTEIKDQNLLLDTDIKLENSDILDNTDIKLENSDIDNNEQHILDNGIDNIEKEIKLDENQQLKTKTESKQQYKEDSEEEYNINIENIKFSENIKQQFQKKDKEQDYIFIQNLLFSCNRIFLDKSNIIQSSKQKYFKLFSILISNVLIVLIIKLLQNKFLIN